MQINLTRVGIPALVGIATVAAAVMVPRYCAGLFSGPEGTRWVVPLMIWMGCVALVFTACVPPLYQRFGNGWAVAMVGAAAYFGALLLFISVQRIFSGMLELECFNVCMILRLAHGGSIYPDPEVAALGTDYTPLLYLLGVPLAKLFPLRPEVIRLVPLAATMGTGFFVFAIVKLRTHDTVSAVTGLALFWATYGIMIHQYDFILVDTILMFFSAATLYFLLRRTPRDDGLALLMAGLACAAKQPGLFLFLATIGILVQARRFKAIAVNLVVWGVVGVALILATHGRAWEYLATNPGRHAWANPVPGVLNQLFVMQIPLWIAFAMGLPAKKDVRFLLVWIAVSIATFMGIFYGSAVSALYPLEPLLCIGAVSRSKAMKVLAAAQLVLGLYNPLPPLFPWSTYRDVDAKAVELAGSVRGDVWFPMEEQLAYVAGKPEWDSYSAIEMRTWGGYPVPERLMNAIRRQRFDMIIVRTRYRSWFMRLNPEITKAVTVSYTAETSGDLVVFRPSARGGADGPGGL